MRRREWRDSVADDNRDCARRTPSVPPTMLTRSLLAASLSAFTMLVAATVVTPARADDEKDKSGAAQSVGRVLFDDGVALFNQGKFAEACPKFEASLKIYPGLGTRGKLAECYEKLGRYASAWVTYGEVADLASRSGEKAREQVARERAKSLEPKLSYLTVVLPPDSHLPGLVIKENGNVLEPTAVGVDRPKDTGTYSFEVTAPNHRLYATRVTLAEGQSARVEVPPLEAILVVDAVPSTTTSSYAVSPAPPSPLASQVEAPSTWQKPAGLAITGAGAVAVVVGAAFGLSAKSKYDNAFDNGGCSRLTNQCDAAGQSSVDSARHAATMSTVVVVAGGVLAATGLVILLTAPSPRSMSMTVAPNAYAGGGGVTLSGSL
ncbi:MAG: tetratricopeptide repeat protein [Polyangiaceae bacterium]|nr:tetratricopeptide repeat protein [Polyangiaceae bacterium]